MIEERRKRHENELHEKYLQLYHNEQCYEELMQMLEEAYQNRPAELRRFGLGYGDFPLTGQKQFLDILDAGRRIGVCVNSGMTLVPTKSVTCIIGLGHNLEVSNVKSCNLCNFREKCTFRKDGKNCGK